MNVDQVPFLCFETLLNGKILRINRLLEESLKKNIRHLHIEDAFQEWTDESDGQLIKAKIENKNCFFFKENLEEERILFIGIFSNELENLTNELRELKKINRHLDAVIENSYDGIYITDKNGLTLRTNSAIERITNIPKEYYMNKKTDDLMKRGILENSVTKQVIEKKSTVSMVQLNYFGRETLLTGNPVLNEAGEVEAVVTNIRDLSELNNLQVALRKANKLNKIYQQEIERLKGNIRDSDEKTIIKSEQMKLIYETVERILNTNATVLILGETGVGKDVLAKFVYERSERSHKGNFIKVNCGAIPADLLESELFGYEGGAFTGAKKQGKQGLFEMANHGVLFLDEIGDMPFNLQVKLLRVIQEREIQRVGGIESIKVDVRIIAATNRNLKKMVEDGQFREDLYYRLNVVPIWIPPLRERREDILPLANLLLGKFNTQYGTMKQLNQELKSFLYYHSWAGNVRELSNVLERMTLLNKEDLLGIEHLPVEYQNNVNQEWTGLDNIITLREATEIAEEKLLLLASKKYHTTYEIAEALNTSQPTVVRKLKKYNIKLEHQDTREKL